MVTEFRNGDSKMVGPLCSAFIQSDWIGLVSVVFRSFVVQQVQELRNATGKLVDAANKSHIIDALVNHVWGLLPEDLRTVLDEGLGSY